jgi:hypothetical protein
VQPLKYKLKWPVITWVMLLGVAFSAGAKANLISPPLNQFMLTNTSADGSINIASDGLSFVLTGGNSGSGLPGTTDFTVAAQNAGAVEFFYSYASNDLPGFDIAGYLLGSTRVPLADTNGESGLGSFSAGAGQTYGWYVRTLDNTGEPGILTVTFTPSTSTVPEPAGSTFALAGIAALAVNQRILIRTRRGEEKNS